MKTIRGLFYIAIWLPLLLCMQWQPPDGYNRVHIRLDANHLLQIDENIQIIHWLEHATKVPSIGQRVQPYLLKAQMVRAATEDYCDYLDRWANSLNGKSDKAVRRMLINQGGEADLRRRWDLTMNFYANNINHSTSDIFKDDSLAALLKDSHLAGGTSGFKESPFVNASATMVTNILSAVKTDLLRTENITLNEINREAYPYRQGSCTSPRAISLSLQTLPFPGETVSAWIGVAEYNTWDKVIVHTKSGTPTFDHGITVLKGIKTEIGRHTISGTATLPVDTYFITKPWSFQYISCPAFAALHFPKSIVYREAINPVTIHTGGLADSAIRLIVPHASISKKGTGSYEIIPAAHAPDRLYAYLVFIDPKGKWDTIAGEELTVRSLPLPSLGIGSKPAANITLADFKGRPYLSIQPADPDFDTPYIILGYNVTLFSKTDGESMPFSVIGNNYGGLTEVLQKAAIGDHVVFSEILVHGTAGKPITLPGCTVLLQ